MNKTLKFCEPPNGRVILDPHISFLKQLVLEGGGDYWNAGSGESTTVYSHDGKQSRLTLMLHEPLGFYLEHVDVDGQHFSSLGPPDAKGRAKVYVCGEPMFIPVSCFVPRELAWAALQSFCKTGGRSKSINWIIRSTLDWRDT